MANQSNGDRYNVTDITPPYDIRCDIKILMLPMRDGVKLHTSIYFPPEFSGKAGVILFRSPYSRTTWLDLPNAEALKAGMIYISQASRGTGWSEGGAFDPAESHYEISDAEDTFNWLKEQDFFNGNCVMTGASYPGWLQWCAAFTGNCVLKGVSPHVAPLYGCTGSARTGGGNALSFAEKWMLAMHHRRHYGYAGVPSYEDMKLNWHLPVNTADDFAGYQTNKPFQKFIAAAAKPYAHMAANRKDFAKIRVPAFISGGWFDAFREESIETFQLMKNSAATENARNFTRMVIGPWVHSGLINQDIFGEENDMRATSKRRSTFLVNLLKNPDADPLPGEKQLRVFILGENRWADFDNWPPPESISRKFYLHSNGRISGSLPGEDETELSYISDPAAPVLSNNGAHGDLGYCDLRESEERSDILLYTSEKFTGKFTIAGKVSISFYASCDQPDTDFFATLSDVYPDGRSMICVTGMIRARFRNKNDQPELLEKNSVYHFEFDIGNIAAAFLPGHRMRIRICGQNFPACDRNQQTGSPIFADGVLNKARCSIRHDAEHPAILTLPEIPSGKI